MTAPAAPRFAHEAYLHRGDEEFLVGALAYVRDGLAQDEVVVVAEPRARLDLVRGALGRDADPVRFLDIEEVGTNPGRLLPLLLSTVAEHSGAGQRLRVLGEGAHAGRRPVELAECLVHEALVNHAFAPGPMWRLLCPYDVAALPEDVAAGALRTHPRWSGPEGGGPSPDFLAAGDGSDLAALSAAAPLPPPTDVVLRGEFGRRDLPAVRRTVRQFARSCGLDEPQVTNLELAASELAANSVQYGGGTGSVGLWREPDAVVVEFTDAGRLEDPLVGRRPPEGARGCGMGLYLVHQLCDLVQVRTGPAGTTVRISTWD